jgi:hypothetical protein
LLHFVGSTPFNTSFTIAYAFFKGEEEADYVWALQALKECFKEYYPQVAVCDRERALILAIQAIFPATKILETGVKNISSLNKLFIPDGIFLDATTKG